MSTSKATAENRKNLIAAIDSLAKRGGISREKAITAWYASVMLDIDEDDAIEAASVDGPEDGGCDFLYVDDELETVYVLQGYVSDRTDRTTPKKKWDVLTAAIALVKDPISFKHAGRADIYEKLQELSELNTTPTIVLGLVSLSAKSDQVDRACNSANKPGSYPGCQFFYEHQDSLHDKYLVAQRASRHVQEDVISFAGPVATHRGEFGDAVIGTVRATELVRMYRAHEDALFEGNIRLFIGERKGGINEKIIETARTKPGVFWALNNGITIVAERIEELRDHRYRLHRFSVVNGCQTTVSLSLAGETADAEVLVRVVDAKKALVTDIVRYNNTQNPVRLSAVRLLDPTQEGLRQAFAAVGIDYAPKQAGARTTRSPKRLELDRVAQLLAATADATVLDAVSNKRDLFDRHYKTIFPRSIRPEVVYLVWLLGQEVEKARTEMLEQQQPDDPVLRAVLGIHGTVWAVYVGWSLIGRSKMDVTKLDLAKMMKDEFSRAVRKYAEKALDLYPEISVNILSEEESPRNAMRVRSFLDKLNRQLTLRYGKYANWRLPNLNGSIASIKA